MVESMINSIQGHSNSTSFVRGAARYVVLTGRNSMMAQNAADGLNRIRSLNYLFLWLFRQSQNTFAY